MRFYLIIALVFSVECLFAQDFEKNGMDTTYVPTGLKVGEKAPDIRLSTIDGKIFSLSDTLKNKQVVLVFYRGQWCPYCSKHLSSLNDFVEHDNG